MLCPLSSAISLLYMYSGNDVVLAHVKATDQTKVSLLGMQGDLEFSNPSDGFHITLPTTLSYTLLPRSAVTIKMTGVVPK